VSAERAGAPDLDALLAQARRLAAAVPDPEIPVLTLDDLGILRSVEREDDRIVVTLTPTYTGCPATEVIRDDVRSALRDAGIDAADVRLSLSPPWTTDWISAQGRRKLREYGIAPPACLAHSTPDAQSVVRVMFRAIDPVHCPRCDSPRIERISEYWSTPCKPLYRCLSCLEPFDYFKPY